MEFANRKLLNFVALVLNIEHPANYYFPVINRLGLNTLADIKREPNLVFLGRLFGD